MKYLFLILFLHFTMAINAQSDSTSLVWETANSKEYKNTVYWKRHRTFKFCAFSALGLGLCGTATGFIGVLCNLPDANPNWRKDVKVWEGILGAGLCLTATSIPLFILSYHNKKKAKKQIRLSVSSSDKSLLSLSCHF